MDVRAVGVGLCCLLVLGGLGISTGISAPVLADSAGTQPGVPHSEGGSGSDVVRNPQAALQDPEPSLDGYDEISVEFDLTGDDGSANVTFEYRYRLDNGNETIDWEDLRSDVENRPDAYLESFRDRRNETLAEAANRTGRDMAMTNFTVETDERVTPTEYGYVRFTFHWSSFAHYEVNRIIAGDTIDGFTMDERTRLSFSWPDVYENVSVQPEPDNRGGTYVWWYGDETREFADGEPRLELLETGGESVQQPEEPDEGVPLLWATAIGIALLVIAVAGLWVWRSRETGSVPETPPPVEPTDVEEQPTSTTDVDPPLELLSNEERVMHLLENHGGRIKQQEVVTELDWTEAKTSQVVSGLRESGQIDVFRIGRENVLTVPEDGGTDGGDRDEDSHDGERDQADDGESRESDDESGDRPNATDSDTDETVSASTTDSSESDDTR